MIRNNANQALKCHVIKLFVDIKACNTNTEYDLKECTLAQFILMRMRFKELENRAKQIIMYDGDKKALTSRCHRLKRG